jgi:hypothetical protein
LEDYVLVVGGKMPPEELLQSPMEVMELRHKLDMAQIVSGVLELLSRRRADNVSSPLFVFFLKR